jgi:choline dehydrogenase
MSERSHWDYVIVGAGSAGCVIASRLSEDPGVRVLLIEAGGSDRSPLILAPAGTDVYVIGNPKYDWCFTTEPDPTRHHRTDLWPRGKVLGGSSSINGTIYIRGHAADYDAWAREGARGWSYADVLPYFKRAERNDLGESEYHGVRGPLSVQSLRYVHPLTRRFVEAAEQSGLPFNPDVNGASQHGVCFNQATQKRGWRHSSARAYLGPARRRSNLKVLTHAQVTRVVFAGRRASGVEYLENGTLKRVNAECEVVLAAGAIGSPQILMLSGVGPANVLRGQGIDVVADRKAVGENLHEHAVTWLVYRMRAPTLNREKSAFRQALHGLNWLLRGRGPATTPGSQAVAFFATDGDPSSQPDIQLHFTPVGYEFTATELKLYDEPTVSVAVNICRPLSRGRITLKSPCATDAPRIEMPLLESEEDVRILIAGCRRAQRIMIQPGIAALVAMQCAPGPNVVRDDEWAGYLRESIVPAYHPVGTCRMGTDVESVVDPELRVRGITGLRVADASIMPRIVSGNTNAAAIMIGEKASDLMRGSQRS